MRHTERLIPAAAALLLTLAACSRATQHAGAGTAGDHAGHVGAPAAGAPASMAGMDHGDHGDHAAAGAPARAGMDHGDHAAGGAMTMRVRHNRHLLIGTDSLAAALARGGVVVVHVGRSDSLYLAGHIPGARFLPLAAVAVTVNGIPNEFPPLAEMQRAFQALQVADSGRIVLVGDDPGLFAARAFAALDLMGHGDRAALLDGGLARWRAERRSLERGRAALPTAVVPFTPRPDPSRVVDAAWVRARLDDPSVVFVDARPADQYAGIEPDCPAGQPGCIAEARRGHIPGATNVFWMNALASTGDPVLRPMHELHHTLWGPVGADSAAVRTVVTYCRSGLQGSHAYFVARYIGYPDVRLYDGGFAEWSALPAATHPVARAAAAAPGR